MAVSGRAPGALALPDDYPNLLGLNDAERGTKGSGPNAKRLADSQAAL